MQYPAQLTPITVELAYDAIFAACQLLGQPLSRYGYLLATAHWCLECGLSPRLNVSKECYNHNPGNHKAASGQAFCYRDCGENVVFEGAAYRDAMLGYPKPTISRHYDEEITTTQGVKVRVKKVALAIKAGHPWSKFRHYDSLIAAAKDHIARLATGNFRHAWPALLNADRSDDSAIQFALRLGTAAYYTAPISVYGTGLVAVYKELLERLDPMPVKKLSKLQKPLSFEHRTPRKGETEAGRYIRILEFFVDLGDEAFAYYEKGTAKGMSTCMVVSRAAEDEARRVPEDGDDTVIVDGLVDYGDYGKEMREGQNTITHGIVYPAAGRGAWVDRSSPAYTKGPSRGCCYYQYVPGVGNSEHVVNVKSVSYAKRADGTDDPTHLILKTIEGGQADDWKTKDIVEANIQEFTREIKWLDGEWWALANGKKHKVLAGWQYRSDTVLAGEGRWPYPKYVEPVKEEPAPMPPALEPEPIDIIERDTVEVDMSEMVDVKTTGAGLGKWKWVLTAGGLAALTWLLAWLEKCGTP